MKKFLAVLLMLCPAVLFAQGSKVFDNLTLNSKILKSERKFAIYLPADYETSGRSYPILYLLHGAGDDQTGWVQFGEVQNITDKAIREGTATAMIIVMPDGNTGRRGYFNDIKGDWNYEDFFFTELMPYIEKKYHVKGEKRYRAISGLSMGGGGTFVYALHHPELFSSACPLSAATGFLTLDEAKTGIARNNSNVTFADSTVSNF
jgi:enterochelin esterase-like enzyme